MKSFTAVLLALSLAANGVIGWWVFRATPSATATAIASSPAPAATTISSATQARGSSTAGASAAATAAEIAQLEPVARYAVYRDQLFAAGIAPDVVAAVIRVCMEVPRMNRTRQLYEGAAAGLPWWQRPPTPALPPAQIRELLEMAKTERADILKVLGPDAYFTDHDTERYATFLSTDKAQRLARLEFDYSEMARNLTQDPGAPVSAERRQALAAEREKDIAALLTPEEFATWEATNSPTARSLSYQFAYFDGTPEEYQKLFAVQRAFDSKYSNAAAIVTLPVAEVAAARRQFTADMDAVLPPERRAQYLQSIRSEYRALLELQQRYQVPQPAFDQVAQLHLRVSAEAQRIGEDTTMNAEQKKTALTDLANQAKTGVRTALGPELGGTYLTATTKTWIDLLEAGNVYSTHMNGSTGVGPAYRPPRPPAAK